MPVEAIIHAERSYSPELTSPCVARGFVSAVLAEWRLQNLTETAGLLTSELATNAVVHAATGFAVRVSLRSEALRVEIADGGPSMPEPVGDLATAEKGRGLALVEAMSDDWGARRLAGGGKVVWFDLAA